MQRVIKFRAWDKTRAKNASYDTFTLTELLQGRVKEYHNYENWEQFTGLTDKNGKEIYEGDVCYWEFLPDKWTNSEVVYSGAAFMLHGQTLNSLARAKVEVIGNIYENSELLTKEKELGV